MTKRGEYKGRMKTNGAKMKEGQLRPCAYARNGNFRKNHVNGRATLLEGG